MNKYNHKKIEPHWQQQWEKWQLNKCNTEKRKTKRYILDMFPYPSGEGLHVGHPEGYTATDIYCRYLRYKGFNVLHPMGWDAFGLPAENYAIKTGTHPRETTEKNIQTFKRQIKSLGFSYDWSREINTVDPEYFKWTQWIFLQLFKKGLAYEAVVPINWCPSCKTGLANEEVVNGRCERCKTPVEKRDMKQWMLKITDYADRLLNGLEKLDWPESIKSLQRNWIGKSEGAEVEFLIPKHSEILLATNNKSKKTRVEKLLKMIGVNCKVNTPDDLNLDNIEVAEDGSLSENAQKKALTYQGKVDMPILALDTGLFIDGVEIDPVKVKRNALAGADEKDLSQEEIGKKMHEYYKKIASDKGGSVNGYWLDAWVLATPDGEVNTSESKREIILTDKRRGEVDIYFPVRSLYKSKVTGKYIAEQTIEDEHQELYPIIEVLKKLLTHQLTVFTTRPDTLFGATYMVLAPEHEVISKFETQILNLKEVTKYVKKAKNKSDLERTDLAKEKIGVELKGVKAINPVNNEEIPIWVADYVLISYGTGAIMAVPAHDERDYEFAKKYNIKIVTVIEPVMGEPQDNEEFRRSIVALVRNPKNGKVLSLNWGKALGGNLFIGGGLKEGEDAIACAQREIAEETGYNNVKFIAKTETIHHHYIAYSKGNVNRFIDAIGLYFELKGKDSGGLKLEKDEKNKFVVEWIDEQTAEQNVSDALHKHVFDRFVKNRPYTDDGIAINSGEFDGLTTNEFKDKITKWLEDKKVGKAAINYKLRDWVFSRQRYWGEPIPLIHCEKCGIVSVPEKDLPLELPEVKKYEPTGTGESPLANIDKWVNVKCPKCGGKGKRETNTMPQWAGSSWYWLRYIDPDNKKEFAGIRKLKYWLPVDVYVGGAEHAVLHLLYARFWNMVLFDLGFVPIEEPFQKLINQGLILGPDGDKMSKSRGNVINPDDILDKYGADTLRMYEMFMGPLEDAKPWDAKGIIGIRRFLDKVNQLKVQNSKLKTNEESLLHKTIKKVGEDIENFRFNTAISAMMILVNLVNKVKVGLDKKSYEKFLIILSPFAPHLAEELWSKLGHEESIFREKWPEYDKKLVKDEKFELVIQINGKVRDKMMVKVGINQPEVEELVKQSDIINKYLDGKEIKKIVYVPDRLVNIVV